MNPWAAKKKLIISSIIGVVLFVVLVLITLPFIQQDPTCFDRRENGDEFGVDCGGSCALYCKEQIAPVIAEYATITRLSDGVYNAVAYLKNTNTSAATATSVPYTFVLKDENNTTVAERSGAIRLGPQETMVAFEHGIQTDGEPAAAYFSFDGAQPWYRVDGDRISLLPISVVERKLEQPDRRPTLRVRLLNDGLSSVQELDIITLLYDRSGELIASGKTVLDALPAESSRTVIFTWPEPFDRAVETVEVIPHFNPYTITF